MKSAEWMHSQAPLKLRPNGARVYSIQSIIINIIIINTSCFGAAYFGVPCSSMELRLSAS